MNKTIEGNEGSQNFVVRKLMYFFALVYFAQGMGQVSGLIGQPLTLYFKDVLGFTASQIEGWMFILVIPWTIKPLYGIVSDFFPILGSRRKSYLLIMNVIAAVGFVMMLGATSINAIVMALLVASVGTAFSDVVIDALMIEKGRDTGKTDQFQGTQWMWMAVSSILASVAGGYLCEWFAPAAALQIASAITIAAPLMVFVVTWLLVQDAKVTISMDEVKTTGRGYLEVFMSRKMWFVALFVAFWNFSPGFGTPWFYYMTNVLNFKQSFIGNLSAIGAVGAVLGAWAFKDYLVPRMSLINLVKLSIWIGFFGTLAYLFISNAWTAVIITFIVGLASQMAFLAVLGVAAQACPKKAEAFAFAGLMSIANLATKGSSNIGAYLYDNVFESNMTPLIWVSALFTLATFAFIPLLRMVQPEVGEKLKKD